MLARQRTPSAEPRARHRSGRPLRGAAVRWLLGSLLHPRGDAETIRVIREVWSELTVGWHKGRWRAYLWDGSGGKLIASARTP